VKQKVLFVAEVECLGDDRQYCSGDCPFSPAAEDAQFCSLFHDALETGLGGIRRSSRCVVAAGNYNILGKCLAGE
jgi:hypothetical protein